MNLIDSHDTPRALTILGGEPARGRGREWQSWQWLSDEQRAYGLSRLKMAAVLQYTLPGVPCLYYGDEAGLEGHGDPFNRACYPWGGEDGGLVEWYRALGRIRAELHCLREGEFHLIYDAGRTLAYSREDKKDAVLAAVCLDNGAREIPLPSRFAGGSILLGDGMLNQKTLTVRGNEWVIIKAKA